MASSTSERGNRGGGFGSMDPRKQREIASMGGKAAHASGNAHEFDSREAREAGRKGGEEVSRDREHMAEIGRKGGEASHGGGHHERRTSHPGTGTTSEGLQSSGAESQRSISRTGGEAPHVRGKQGGPGATER